MAFRNPFKHNEFESNSEHWSRLIADVDAKDADAQAEDGRTTAALADALGAYPLDDELIAALRAKRKTLAETHEELRVVRDHYVTKLAEAQQAEFEAANAAEIAAQRKAAETRKRSLTQHIGEARRQLSGVPELLAQLHERIELAQEEVDKAELIVGHGFLDISPLLRRAFKAAALEDWFRAPPLGDSDRSPVRPLADELDDTVDAAMALFEIEAGLKQPAPPSADEIAAAQEAEQLEADRVAAEEAHRAWVTSPEYDRQQRAAAGRAPLIPGSIEAEKRRRDAEQLHAHQMQQAKGR